MPEAAIEVQDLRKTYGEVTALAGIDLAVPQGTVLGLLGPNGAGKTTAVRIVTTLLPPDGGSARSRAWTWSATPPSCARRSDLAGQ
jgi:ABC-2 type transport system ATP-binding protein